LPVILGVTFTAILCSFPLLEICGSGKFGTPCERMHAEYATAWLSGDAEPVEPAAVELVVALDGPNDEFKELGDTFDGLLARLDASFHSQRQFVANASHELRTPLARLKTLVQVTLADPTPASSRFARPTNECLPPRSSSSG
jgi:signal transduction histidine kinase